MRETGIAHDLFADPDRAGAAAGEVDLVPLILSPRRVARSSSAALIQRARLFEAILADLYGPQRLLRARASIPPALVFSDPAFLRPCHGIAPAGGLICSSIATDLAREADGRWRVIDNHTETPAGIGYALANRMVHTNVAGDLFGACNGACAWRRSSSSCRRALARAAPAAAIPRIALLTPGPRHNDFFSHAYLARYLGFCWSRAAICASSATASP